MMNCLGCPLLVRSTVVVVPDHAGVARHKIKGIDSAIRVFEQGHFCQVMGASGSEGFGLSLGIGLVTETLDAGRADNFPEDPAITLKVNPVRDEVHRNWICRWSSLKD